MDHLILDEDSFEYPEIPYLESASGSVYDNAGFADFPQRVGWSWPEIRAIAQKQPPMVERRSHEEVAAFVQAWMYFGLIHGLTMLPVDTSKYVHRNTHGRLVVTSKPLLGHLQAWQSMLASQKDQGLEIVAHVDKLWKISHYFLFHLAVMWEDLLPQTVRASIVVLHQTLALAKMSLYPNSYNPPSLCNFHDYFHKQIRAPLVEHGWCRMTVHRLGQLLSPLTLYHMASIKKALPSKSNSHTDCSNHLCQLSKPSREAFKFQHTVPKCECQPVPSIQDEVTSIVEKGNIPIISFSDSEGLSIQSLSLEPQGQSMDYVAISHVWADGLGNPEDNTMYRCQLRFLQDRISKLLRSQPQNLGHANKDSQFFFWIDTLCVPARESVAKSTAIAMMEEIYRKASIVLVIDANLKALGSVITSPFQVAISIASSKWWTRLWTLQEGLFAKSLYFQFSDNALSAADIIQSSREQFSNSNALEWDVQSMLIQDALSEVQKLSVSRLRSDSGRYLVQYASWRSTTRKADEAICLAILLNLPVRKITELEEDPKVRMKAFILMQRFFPRSILFGRGNHEDRFEDEGYRWAPITLLGRVAGPSSFDNLFSSQWIDDSPTVDTTYADEQGLHLQSCGFRLDFRNCVGKAPQTLKKEASGDSRLCLIIAGPQQGCYSLKIIGRTTLSWEKFLGWGLRLFLILPRFLEAGNRSLAGVLVSAPVEAVAEKSKIVCRYECLIGVYLLERHLTGGPYTEWPFSANVPGAIQATALEVEQQWCVR